MKAVAIPYVVALILGVIVLGIVGYWFVSQGGKTVSAGNTAQCDSLCVLWRNSAFNVKPAGIDKCLDYSAKDGTNNCMKKLDCALQSSCGLGQTDYGPFQSLSSRLCCTQ